MPVVSLEDHARHDTAEADTALNPVIEACDKSAQRLLVQSVWLPHPLPTARPLSHNLNLYFRRLARAR